MQHIRNFIGSLVVAWATAALAAPVTSEGTWEISLKGRDLQGHAVSLDDPKAVFFYDETLDVTWLGNMNSNGLIDHAGALQWVSSLNVGNFGGWRLPKMAINPTNPGCDPDPVTGANNCGMNPPTSGNGQYSELAHLFYVTLGNLAYCAPGGNLCLDPQPGWGLTNTAYFQDLNPTFANGSCAFYWYDQVYAPDPKSAWSFCMSAGNQGGAGVDAKLVAAAVRPGDVLQVATVPEPGSLALVLLAFSSLVIGSRQSRPGRR